MKTATWIIAILLATGLLGWGLLSCCKADGVLLILSGSAPAPDTDAPTPNPATFVPTTGVPAAISSSAISMTATTGTDATGVEYSFVCTVGGGHDSGWQSSPVYVDSGLTASTEYTYTVQMRDTVGTPNVGTASSASNATTLPSGGAVYVSPLGSGTESGEDASNTIAWADYETITPGSQIYISDMNTVITDSSWSDNYEYYANEVNLYDEIGWTFDSYYRVGQFITKDIWVVGPITIVGIEPEFEELTCEPMPDPWNTIHNGDIVNSTLQFSVYAEYTGVDPCTIGVESILGSSTSVAKREAMSAVISETGDVNAIYAYLSASGSCYVTGGIYDGDGTYPVNRLGYTASTLVDTGPGWQKIPLITPASVTLGQKIWITWSFSTTNHTMKYQTTGGEVASAGDGTYKTGLWHRNGSMLNPMAGRYQGFDSRPSGVAEGYYDSAINVAIDINVSTPLQVDSGSTLISSKSYKAPDLWPQLETSAVLTVLSSPSSSSYFRPGLVGTNKVPSHTVSELDREGGYTYLANLTPVGGMPSLSSVEAYFNRTWIEVQLGWLAGHTYPGENMKSYGTTIARETTNAALMLNMDHTGGNPELDNNDLKRNLLIKYVQVGLDNYSVIADAGVISMWPGDAGIFQGRKLPIFIAAIALNDADMLAMFSKTGDYLFSYTNANGYPDPYGPSKQDSDAPPQYLPPDYVRFQEDDQVFYITKFHVDITNNATGIIVGPGDKAYPVMDFASAFDGCTGSTISDSNIGFPEWGITAAHKPWVIGYTSTWDRPKYKYIAGCTYPGTSLAVLIMGQKTLWNHPAFFDYCDQYMRMIEDIDEVWGVKDDPGDPDWNYYNNRAFWITGTYGIGTWTENLWLAYRNDYGTSWKPNPEDPNWP